MGKAPFASPEQRAGLARARPHSLTRSPFASGAKNYGSSTVRALLNGWIWPPGGFTTYQQRVNGGTKEKNCHTSPRIYQTPQPRSISPPLIAYALACLALSPPSSIRLARPHPHAYRKPRLRARRQYLALSLQVPLHEYGPHKLHQSPGRASLTTAM